MTEDEIRKCENFVLSRPLADINHPENLHFLAMLITDHDHLRSKLMSEPDRRLRREKLDAMRPYLDFKPLSADDYEMAEFARQCGVQPIYEEQRRVSSLILPPSMVHEVPN